MQTVDKTIYLMPALPKHWDVKFKLHAPHNTIIEGQLKNGKLENLLVTPKSRFNDVVIMLK